VLSSRRHDKDTDVFFQLIRGWQMPMAPKELSFPVGQIIIR